MDFRNEILSKTLWVFLLEIFLLFLGVLALGRQPYGIGSVFVAIGSAVLGVIVVRTIWIALRTWLSKDRS